MGSTNVVNFSLRQNKSIERSIAFDCAALAASRLRLRNMVYVGLGSVWFSDFVMAHRLLGIETMISIESDPIIYKRAQFNRPYRTVEIIEGDSTAITPQLLDREDLAGRPWVIWLDYDEQLDEAKIDELVSLVNRLPSNSFLLTTFSALGSKYGSAPQRPERIQNLFGISAPENLDQRACNDMRVFMRILEQSTLNLLFSAAISSGRPGGFVPAVKLMYRDSTPMVTVGGVLPSEKNEQPVKALVADRHWPGLLNDVIETPPLTPKEVLALQSRLPDSKALTRADVISMGFDLDEEMLKSYEMHYLRYPSFAQLAR